MNFAKIEVIRKVARLEAVKGNLYTAMKLFNEAYDLEEELMKKCYLKAQRKQKERKSNDKV